MNRTIARDNFFPECPAVMAYSAMTDYRTAAVREHHIKKLNGFIRDDDYRQFLQNNAEKILDAQWDYNNTNFMCHPNVCLHNYPTRVTDADLKNELKRYTAVKSGKEVSPPPACPKLPEYRTTYNGNRLSASSFQNDN